MGNVVEVFGALWKGSLADPHGPFTHTVYRYTHYISGANKVWWLLVPEPGHGTVNVGGCRYRIRKFCDCGSTWVHGVGGWEQMWANLGRQRWILMIEVRGNSKTPMAFARWTYVLTHPIIEHPCTVIIWQSIPRSSVVISVSSAKWHMTLTWRYMLSGAQPIVRAYLCMGNIAESSDLCHLSYQVTGSNLHQITDEWS